MGILRAHTGGYRVYSDNWAVKSLETDITFVLLKQGLSLHPVQQRQIQQLNSNLE